MITITIKSYPKETENLVEICKNYINSFDSELGFLIFTHKRPKYPKNNNRRIMGLKAECVSYLNDDRELIKMSPENFICLMAKYGVDMEIKREKEGEPNE
jgi:hypothetical protein